jgi:hypothetical protein
VKTCDRCSQPLAEGRRWGLCEECRQLCPQCGQPTTRPTPGYCANCQRKRREQKPAPSQPGQPRTRRPVDEPVPGDPLLREGQVWFPNPRAEQRIPVQQITLDIERTARILQTWYTPNEFENLMDLVSQERKRE